MSNCKTDSFDSDVQKSNSIMKGVFFLEEVNIFQAHAPSAPPSCDFFSYTVLCVFLRCYKDLIQGAVQGQ